jgi:hypothetical protein
VAGAAIEINKNAPHAPNVFIYFFRSHSICTTTTTMPQHAAAAAANALIANNFSVNVKLDKIENGKGREHFLAQLLSLLLPPPSYVSSCSDMCFE